MNAPRRALHAAIAIWAATAVPAAATQSLRTEVTSSGASPVRIDSCRAELLDKAGPGGLIPSIVLAKRNYYIAAAVDFTNVSPQTLNGVRFIFDIQDTFGAITESVGLDWLGTFSPGVPIEARRNLAGTVGAVSQENAASSPTNVICHVQYARFDDDRIWKEGDRSAPVAPGLYYPPTPPPHRDAER